MRTHSNEFAKSILLIGKRQDVKIKYGETELNSDDVNSVTYSFEASLLKSVMQELVIDSNTEIEKGTEFNFQYGLYTGQKNEYLDYGNFIVYSVKRKEDTKSYEIKAYDKMLYAMKDYEEVDCTYPCSLDTFIKAVCKKLGYTLVTMQYPNMNRQINSDVFTGINYTYRDVLDDIAEATASTIYLRNTSLYLGQPQESGITIDEESLKDTNVNFDVMYGPINSVVLSRSGGSDNVYSKDEESIALNGLCELKITDNQLMNLNDRSDYLQEILDSVKGITYYLNDFSSTGIMYLELLDYYNVNIGENTYKCLLLNDEQDITQGLVEEIHTDRPEKAETDYKKADKTDQKINQAYLIVDKQNQSIEALLKQTTETSNKMSQMTATVDGLEAKVENIQDFVREKNQTDFVYVDDIAEGQGYVLDFKVYGSTQNFTKTQITICSSEKPKEDPFDSQIIVLDDVLRDLKIGEKTYRDTLDISQDGTVTITRRIGTKEIAVNTENVYDKDKDITTKDLIAYNVAVTQQTEYTLSFDDSNYKISRIGFYESTNLNGMIASTTEKIFTTPENCNYLCIEFTYIGTAENVGDGTEKVNGLKLCESGSKASLHVLNAEEVTTFKANILKSKEKTYFYISGLNSLDYYLKYIIKNDYSDTFLPKVELGTRIEQNAEHVKIAWNQISDYIQLMVRNGTANFAILDKDKKVLMYLDKDGQHFCDESESTFRRDGRSKSRR